jgi:hypothetical protein
MAARTGPPAWYIQYRQPVLESSAWTAPPALPTNLKIPLLRVNPEIDTG